MRAKSGFTLIELIMVIVILGVLSAFALPRFADLGGEARKASLNGLAGSIKSAANIAHAKQLVTGGAASASVDLDGKTITMSEGYPTANAAGIVTAAGISSSEFTITAGTKTVDIQIKANCKVVYNEATSTAALSVVVTHTGC